MCFLQPSRGMPMSEPQLNQSNPLAAKPVGRLLVSLAIPAILAQIVSILYNLVDRIFIGQAVGSLAMAGVGISTPIVQIIMGFTSLLGLGGAPLCAIRMGEGDYKTAEKLLGTCFTALLTAGAVIMAAVLLFTEPLLRLFGASDSTVSPAASYLSVYALGTIFVMISIGLNAFITTQGFAKISMVTTIIGAATNIALDSLFILVFDMGVAGAALATILAQGLSALWVLRFLTGSNTRIRLQLRHMRPNFKLLLPVLGLGASPFFMDCTEGLLLITFNTQLLKFGGDIAVSAMTILSSMFLLVMLIAQGVNQGAQPIISFNYGAGQFARVRKAYKLAVLLGVAYSAAVTTLMVFVPQLFVSIFTKDSALLELACALLPVYMFGGFIIAANSTHQQTYTALGQGKRSFCFAFLRKIVLLIPLIYILPALFPTFSIPGIAVTGPVLAVIAAEPISDILTTVTNAVFFRRFYKKRLADQSALQASASDFSNLTDTKFSS